MPNSSNSLKLERVYYSTDGARNFKHFVYECSKSGNYSCSFWLQASKLVDGSYTSFDVSVRNERVGRILCKSAGWQAVSIEDKDMLFLTQGLNIISISTLCPEFPDVESLRIALPEDFVDFNAEEYKQYVENAKHNVNMLEESGISYCSQSSVFSYNLENVLKNVPLKYSFYKRYTFREGEVVRITSSSRIPHAIDFFYLGQPYSKENACVETYLKSEIKLLEDPNYEFIKPNFIQPTNDDLLLTTAKSYKLDIISQNKYMPLWYTLRRIDGNNCSTLDIANKLHETNFFESVEPDFCYNGLEISYDSYIDKQWGLYNKMYEDVDISVSEAWNYATGYGVNIAFVDEGVDMNHEDLKYNFYCSYDAEKDSVPNLIFGSHGTHCAGIAAALRNNGKGISGVAPDAKIMSARVSFLSTRTNEIFSRAINWAWQNGADVISCSWKCTKSSLISNAIDNALKYGRNGKGCIFVKSAGNTGDTITWPGGYCEDIIAVASITNMGQRASSSSHGKNMLISAPGTGILSTLPNQSYGSKSGTSMAAPHVAGVVALLLEIDSELTSAKVREYLGRSAQKIGNMAYDNGIKPYGSWNEYYGYGLLNALEAVKLVLPYIKIPDKQ